MLEGYTVRKIFNRGGREKDKRWIQQMVSTDGGKRWELVLRTWNVRKSSIRDKLSLKIICLHLKIPKHNPQIRHSITKD